MGKNVKKSYEMDLCSGPILPQLLKFTLPIMATGLLQLMFNAADIIVVGHWCGDNALAAVGSNTAMISLLTCLFIGFSIGANILAARQYGACDERGMQETVHTSILLSLLSGLLLAVVGLFTARTLLIWMHTPEGILEMAALYLRIYFLCMPANMIYNFGAALLRAIGDTRRPLYYLCYGGIINLVLNCFFVIVCHWGVAGVGIGTLVSQTISALLIIRCMRKETGGIHLSLRQLRIYPIRLKQILQIGVPAGLEGILFSLSNVIIQASINSFGEVIVAGSTVGSNIENFIFNALYSFQQSGSAFVSQNFGAGKYERIRPVLFWSQTCVVILGVLMGIAAVVFGPDLLSFFSESPEVISAGMDRIKIICTTCFICGMMDVLVGVVRGIGKAVIPVIITLVGVCVLRVAMIFVLTQIPAFNTIINVYITYPVSWIITLCAQYLYYRYVMRQLIEHQGVLTTD